MDLTPSQVEKLWTFHRFLRKRDRDLNLTRIHNFENMVVKHYVDSMLPARMVDFPSPLLDLGSGAGFPGVPIKILRPELHVILAEGRGKRAAFLEEVVRLLGLEGLEVLGRKIAPGVRTHDAAGIITRAVEDAEKTLERVRRLLPPGGRVFLMKGPGCEAEVLRARERFQGVFTLVEDRSYVLPGTPHRRRLVVFRRIEDRVRSASAPLDRAASVSSFRGKVRECSSAQNRSFLSLRKLLTGRGIRKEHRALMAGRRVVEEVLREHGAWCRGWITTLDPSQPPPPEGAPGGLVWYRFSPDLFRELDIHGTGSPLLLVEAPPFPPFRPEGPWPEGCTLFLPFQDPENMGAAIRSAAGLGAARVVILEEGAHPFLPRAARAAGSCLFKIPLLSGPPLDALRTGKVPLLALAPGGRALGTFPWPERFGLAAGLEGPGLPPEFAAEHILAVPMERGVESLNAAASVAVALYAWRSATNV